MFKPLSLPPTPRIQAFRLPTFLLKLYNPRDYRLEFAICLEERDVKREIVTASGE